LIVADTLNLEVATPLGLVLKTQADSVQAPSVKGEFGVLPGHLPLLAALKPGVLRYRVGAHVNVAAVSAGFVEAGFDRVLMLTDAFDAPKDIDEGAARGELDSLASRTGEADAAIEQTSEHAAEVARGLPDLEAAVRAAQAAVTAQRGAVAEVQQEIQVLAAERRSTQEQQRGLEQRRERLAAESRQLADPDLERLADLQQRYATAGQTHAAANARLTALQDEVPALDVARRAEQERVNAESATHADLAARLAALQAL